MQRAGNNYSQFTDEEVGKKRSGVWGLYPHSGSVACPLTSQRMGWGVSSPHTKQPWLCEMIHLEDVVCMVQVMERMIAAGVGWGLHTSETL